MKQWYDVEREKRRRLDIVYQLSSCGATSHFVRDSQGSTYSFLETRVHGKPVILAEIMAYLTHFNYVPRIIFCMFEAFS